MTVFGDGSQTRSFCYVSDLIDGIYRLALSDYDAPVNIGNPREMTILEFGRAILEITGSQSPIIRKPLPTFCLADVMKYFRASVSDSLRVLQEVWLKGLAL